MRGDPGTVTSGELCDSALVGFDLNCVFTLDTTVFALFDRVIPGGSGYALATGGGGWPDGWVLPAPWELEFGTDGERAMDTGVLEPPDPGAWRAMAGIPEEPVPFNAFVPTDFQLGALLSLAAPVVLIDDDTFGGVLCHEYAACFEKGELAAAYGIDFLDHTAFELDAGAYRAVEPGDVSPATQCLERLDARFAGRFLFDGYLPRDAHRDGPPCREAWTGPAPSLDPAWRRHFPKAG